MASVVQEGRVFLPEQTKDQSNFCVDLMLRLAEDIVEMEPDVSGVKGHYRMMQDITRLRRELLRLSKMIDMTWRQSNESHYNNDFSVCHGHSDFR